MKEGWVLLTMMYLTLIAFAQFGDWAVISDRTQTTLDVSFNCNPSGMKNDVRVSVDIYNPMPVQMKVSYEYLDLATNEYLDQPERTYCYVPALQRITCKFSVPIRLGGRGNGTISDVELIRLKGEDAEGRRTDSYTASFKFYIKHMESDPETNILKKIKEAEAYISQASSKIPCIGIVCCGMGGASAKIEKARQDIENAMEKIKLCNLTSAYSFASSAYANSKNAADSVIKNTDACIACLANYESAKSAVGEAESLISKMGCTVNSEATTELERAKTKLSSAAFAIASDNYESANLELQDAKKSANSAKNSAKCATNGSSEQEASKDKKTSGQQPQKEGKEAGREEKVPPLCPIGVALMASIMFGAFAYIKR